LTLHTITVAAEARLLDELTTLAARAAAVILTSRAEKPAARTKPDQSPVTAADEAAEAVIIEGISRLCPGLAIVSEEAAGLAAPGHLGERFFLVDPLDGTREFVAGHDEFTVNIALIADGQPVLGVIAAPARGLIWRAAGGSAERLRMTGGAPAAAAQERATITPRPWPGGRPVAAVSRSHCDPRTEGFLARIGPVERLAAGSSLKLCWIAEGSADVYPRLGPTREWDIAAGHAIVTAAGGKVATPDGGELRYGGVAAGFLVPGFVAWGDPTAALGLGPRTSPA
jgi:3'(2'), 5'-bisphosphate nucleotidase